MMDFTQDELNQEIKRQKLHTAAKQKIEEESLKHQKAKEAAQRQVEDDIIKNNRKTTSVTIIRRPASQEDVKRLLNLTQYSLPKNIILRIRIMIGNEIFIEMIVSEGDKNFTKSFYFPYPQDKLDIHIVRKNFDYFLKSISPSFAYKSKSDNFIDFINNFWRFMDFLLNGSVKIGLWFFKMFYHTIRAIVKFYQTP